MKKNRKNVVMVKLPDLLKSVENLSPDICVPISRTWLETINQLIPSPIIEQKEKKAKIEVEQF